LDCAFNKGDGMKEALKRALDAWVMVGKAKQEVVE
jgi:hypothetical protein